MANPNLSKGGTEFLEMKDSELFIKTQKYEAFDVNTDNLPEALSENLNNLVNLANDFLAGKDIDPEANKKSEFEASYEVDGETVEGIIRPEAIVSFYNISDDGKTLNYIIRGRPDSEGINTPGKEDPGTIFHGALNRGIINVARMAADWNSKVDNTVTEEEIKNSENFIQGKGLKATNIGTYILANGHISRNIDGEKPTSGIFSAMGISCDNNLFEEIVSKSSSYFTVTLDIKTGEILNGFNESDFTPKHKLYHNLLLKSVRAISAKSEEITDEVSDKVGNIL
ncbi:MAG: hypothetical protein PHR68_04735 [Candidatus Gracilibacteria bacterium]|nr:hypothetical protein [Candidatus Gracilibacteria bacterium]